MATLLLLVLPLLLPVVLSSVPVFSSARDCARDKLLRDGEVQRIARARYPWDVEAAIQIQTTVYVQPYRRFEGVGLQVLDEHRTYHFAWFPVTPEDVHCLPRRGEWGQMTAGAQIHMNFSPYRLFFWLRYGGCIKSCHEILKHITRVRSFSVIGHGASAWRHTRPGTCRIKTISHSSNPFPAACVPPPGLETPPPGAMTTKSPTTTPLSHSTKPPSTTAATSSNTLPSTTISSSSNTKPAPNTQPTSTTSSSFIKPTFSTLSSSNTKPTFSILSSSSTNPESTTSSTSSVKPSATTTPASTITSSPNPSSLRISHGGADTSISVVVVGSVVGVLTVVTTVVVTVVAVVWRIRRRESDPLYLIRFLSQPGHHHRRSHVSENSLYQPFEDFDNMQ